MTSVQEKAKENTDLPPLTYKILTTEDDKRNACRLITDSIAQQRQIASISIIFHPIVFASLAITATALWTYSSSEFGTKLISVCGLIITFLVTVRMFTAAYIHAAEDFQWDQFISGPNGEDVVFGAQFGDALIGTLVLRLDKTAHKGKAKTKKANTALIRAWTTKMRYRGKGVGGDLLRLAVAKAFEASSADIMFDPSHANSLLPLYNTFNRAFKTRDEKARKALTRAMNDVKRQP